jgi:hypothetical protein
MYTDKVHVIAEGLKTLVRAGSEGKLQQHIPSDKRESSPPPKDIFEPLKEEGGRKIYDITPHFHKRDREDDRNRGPEHKKRQ